MVFLQAAHLFGSILFTIFCGTTVIYPLSAVRPFAEMIMGCLKHTKVDAITLTPPYVEEIGRSPEILDFLSQNVEALFWAGGDVSLNAGEFISSKMKLFTTCGSTEMGMWPTIRQKERWSPEHWRFMRFHPDEGIEFRHRTADLYEGCVKRQVQPEYEQPIFKNFSALEEYSSGDLFSRHELDPQLWQYRGRIDDLQICSTGDKFHPVAVEQRLARHPDVQEVLLVLTLRSQAALLIEMKTEVPLDTYEQRAEVIAHLWPAMEEVNQICPAYAQLSQELILFVSSTKLMVRTAKGSVQRSKTIELYNQELDELYNQKT